MQTGPKKIARRLCVLPALSPSCIQQVAKVSCHQQAQDTVAAYLAVLCNAKSAAARSHESQPKLESFLPAIWQQTAYKAAGDPAGSWLCLQLRHEVILPQRLAMHKRRGEETEEHASISQSLGMVPGVHCEMRRAICLPGRPCGLAPAALCVACSAPASSSAAAAPEAKTAQEAASQAHLHDLEVQSKLERNLAVLTQQVTSQLSTIELSNQKTAILKQLVSTLRSRN